MAHIEALSELFCNDCKKGICEKHKSKIPKPKTVIGTAKVFTPEKKEVTLFKDSNLVNTQNNQNE